MNRILKIGGSHLLLLISLIWLIAPASTYAQIDEYLLLEKPGKKLKKRVRFYIGDEIEFSYADEKGYVKGTLVKFSDSSIFINDYQEIALRQIDAVAIRSQVETIRNIGGYAMIIGSNLIGLSAVNGLIGDDGGTVINPNIMYVSGPLLAFGLFSILYKGRRCRLDNKWRVIMVRH